MSSIRVVVLVLCALWAHDAAGQATIVGTAGNDVIRPAALGGSNNGLPAATPGDDVIDGLAGNDEITPGPGSDTVRAGDGDDTIFLLDGDAAPEEVLHGNGGFNRLVIVGSGSFDLTGWVIVDIQGLTLANGATVRLRPDQVLGFTDIAGVGGTLELAEPPAGTAGTYPLLPRIGTGIAPFTTIVGSNGDDLASLPEAPGSPITFNGGAGHDRAVLPGAASDYGPLPGAPFPPAPQIEVRDGTGALLYTLVDVEAVLFAADLPSLSPLPDQVEATIGQAGSFDPLVILGNDSGYGLSIVSPSRGRDAITQAGGRLSSPGAGMALTYSPPAEIIPFTDTVPYAVEDVLGNVATADVHFDVANRAPTAPNRSFIRLAGGIVLVEELLAGVSDPDGGNVAFAGFDFDPATGFAEPVYEPGTTSLVGYRVFEGTTTPGVGRFLYRVRDDSGAIGSSDEGEVTVTFVPLEARDDNLRGTAPSADGAVHGELIWTDVLLANDAPGVIFDELVGATATSSPGTFLLTVFDPATGRHVATVYYETADPQLKHIRYYAEEAGAFTFSYRVSDGAGGTATATVTVTVDNRAPVATPQIIPVPGGAPVTVQLRDLAFGGVHGPPNADADGDPIVFSCYALLPANDPRGSLQGFGPQNLGDPTDFGSVVFTPAPGSTGDVTLNYCIKDRPDLGGAERNSFSNSTFTFRVGPPPVVAFQSTNAGAIAEGGLHQIQITRTGDLSGTTTVSFAIRGGTAATDDIGLVRGTDHVNGGFATLGTGFGTYSLTFRPGVHYVVLAVESAQDGAVEPDETFVLELLSATGATLGDPSVCLATGTILNDDVLPVVGFQSTSAGAIAEGGLHQVQITRTGNLAAASTVTFAIRGGTATTDDIGLVRGTDHVNGGFGTLGTGFGTYSLTFNPGVNYVALAVASAQDSAVEPDETFVLELLSATGATLGDPSVRLATGTILNDDVPPPQVEVMRYVNEPSTSTEAVGGVPGYATFYFRRTGPDLSQPTVVHWTLEPAQPQNPSYVSGQSGDIVGGFRSGSIVLSGTSTLFVPLGFAFANDAIVEPTEWFRFTITGYDNGEPLDPIGVSYFEFRIEDDDQPPVNTPPVGVNDDVSTSYETPVVIAVLANDTDAENDPLAAGAFANLVGGTLSLPGDGTVLFTPNPGFTGPGGFTYRPYDGQAQGNVTTVTVIVGAPPPPPCAADLSGAISVTKGVIRYVWTRQRFEQVVTLTNTTNAAIPAPVDVALTLDGLGTHVTMVNASGVTSCAAPAGSPYIVVPIVAGRDWGPGVRITLTLAFTTTQNLPITYTTRVLGGTSR